MAVTCTAESLRAAAKCFVCVGLGEKQLLAISAYIKCQTLNGEAVTCNAEQLLAGATAAGLVSPGISLKTLMAINAYLDCQINNTGGGGGGGGNGIVCSNTAGGAPSITPTSGCGILVDTSTGNLWAYYNGAWNALIG
jgi:hypothetical protein